MPILLPFPGKMLCPYMKHIAGDGQSKTRQLNELCQYWMFEDFHCTKFNAIRAHIMLLVVMFNLHILFKSKYGRRFSEKSIAAKRAPGFEPAHVIVYCGDYFGIFDIKEYTNILSAGKKASP